MVLSCSWARVNASRAPKGSSINSTLGCMASARAMPTLFHAARYFAGHLSHRVSHIDQLKVVADPLIHFLIAFKTVKYSFHRQFRIGVYVNQGIKRDFEKPPLDPDRVR